MQANQQKGQGQQTQGWLIEKARAIKVKESEEFASAKAAIPEWLHGGIVAIERNQKMYNQQVVIDQVAQSLGLWSSDKGTYLSVSKPYLTVEARVAWARHEHKEKGCKLTIQPVQFDSQSKLARVTIDSEIHGSVTATAKLGVGGGGVDSTNPFENAETSVIGRALGFLGYVLLGSGIASAEEVHVAIEEAEKKEKPRLDVVEGGQSQQQTTQEPRPISQMKAQQSQPTFVGTVTQNGQGPVENNGRKVARSIVTMNGQNINVYGIDGTAPIVAAWKQGQEVEFQARQENNGSLVVVTA
ncbi:hypothetical protein F9B85_10050 [Heliorestis acidaminivorans]|uniref:Uncharacterized protein n=1 Tax=Heliorestis acidaminivorans TaxID=553427 RepID=A0A6I0EZS0_9FIRM|nr:hypothetical protein [Heliorestis acidaminivorans]KAB2952145.1 hypothetical protein F9B85_10050 [Heliorestis acidaminivorans]